MISYRHLALTAVLLFASAAVIAQETTARLSGTVTDTTGAAVPNATLTLVNPQTKAVITYVTSRDEGRYTALQLPPGTYS